MVGYDSHICKGENIYEITYYTDNEENYKHIQNEIRKQIDKKEE